MDESRTDKITNLSEFMAVIMEEFSHITPNPFYERERFFFRGQSNKNYTLQPSIARQINDNVSYLRFENQLIQSAKLQSPEEFSGIEYPANMLAKMQHYGLPTRMLDVTENALIALYFACKSKQNNEEIDGEVFCFKVEENEVHSAYSIYANIIASLYTELSTSFDIEKFIDRIKDENFIPKSERRKSSAYIIKQTVNIMNQPIFISPEMLTEREKRQQAAFLIYPNKIELQESIYNKKGKYVVVQEINDIKTTKAQLINKTVTIAADYKRRILSELELFGISEQFVFPEIEKKCNAIKNQVEYKVINEIR
jgi:hypothetical protein